MAFIVTEPGTPEAKISTTAEWPAELRDSAASLREIWGDDRAIGTIDYCGGVDGTPEGSTNISTKDTTSSCGRIGRSSVPNGKRWRCGGRREDKSVALGCEDMAAFKRARRENLTCGNTLCAAGHTRWESSHSLGTQRPQKCTKVALRSKQGRTSSVVAFVCCPPVHTEIPEVVETTLDTDPPRSAQESPLEMPVTSPVDLDRCILTARWSTDLRLV